MSAADVRDVLDLPGPATDGVRKPPAKKQKTVEKRPDGITRELYALLGEHPPPVSLKLEARFKERPRWHEKAKPWEWRAFQNPARNDGLVLHHWVAATHKPSVATTVNGTPASEGNQKVQKKVGRKNVNGDSEDQVEVEGDTMDIDGEDGNEVDHDPDTVMENGEGSKPTIHEEKPPDSDYHFARFNISPNVLTYTDDEYNVIGMSDEWSREETDYLFDLCREYDLRWVIIADRYDYQPKQSIPSAPPPPTDIPPNTDGEATETGTSSSTIDSNTALMPPPPPKPTPRTIEDIKHRYYHLTRSLLLHRTPRNLMTPDQLQYTNLLNFDKEKEASRKRTALMLWNRTPEEVKEEELLLVEMKRILANQEKLLEERQDLFARLDAPQSTGSIAAYTGSAGLQTLAQMLNNGVASNINTQSIGQPGSSAASTGAVGTPASEKPPPSNMTTKKRKSVGGGALGIDTAAASSGDRSTPNTAIPGQTPTTSHHKKSLSTSTDKTGGASSLSTPTTSTHAGGPGSNTPRQLTSQEEAMYGVAYHEKIASGVYLRSSKVASVKGANQPKVQTALHELGVPAKLTMATIKTCQKMEQLNQQVSWLLDAKKLSEKLDQELRVEQARLEALG